MTPSLSRIRCNCRRFPELRATVRTAQRASRIAEHLQCLEDGTAVPPQQHRPYQHPRCRATGVFDSGIGFDGATVMTSSVSLPNLPFSLSRVGGSVPQWSSEVRGRAGGRQAPQRSPAEGMGEKHCCKAFDCEHMQLSLRTAMFLVLLFWRLSKPRDAL